MTKYKLIKSYPGCKANLGAIVTISIHKTYNIFLDSVTPLWNRGIKQTEVENYPEFWKKVEEPRFKCGQLIYRILPSGKKILGIACISKYENRKFTINKEKSELNATHFYSLEMNSEDCGVSKNEIYGFGNYKYEVEEKDYEILEEEYIPGQRHAAIGVISLGHKIKSIKRLSDGEVFTAGDKVNSTLYDTKVNRKITGFEIRKEELLIQFEVVEKYVLRLDQITKPKTPLFTTEDGVDVFEDNEFTIVQKHTFDTIHKAKYIPGYPDEWMYFSTKEAAEKYISENKPKYSEKDIKEALQDAKQCGMNELQAVLFENLFRK
jgi:hypothetical protein